MKKFFILLLGLTFMAASCDLTGGLFDLGTGTRGVVKSEDSGETYSAANILQKKGDISGIGVNSLVFDPSKPDTLYLGSSNGIYKSEDAAKSWRYILSGITIADIALDPLQSNVIYAAGIVGANGKIIKSLDGGVSWVDIYTEPSKNNTVLSIAVGRSNSLVLAGLTTGEILRSVDKGHTWQASKDFADRITKILLNASGTVYALTFHKGLMKSTDQGISWTMISDLLTKSSVSSFDQAPSSVSAFYDMALDQRQPGVLYLGTQEGLYRSTNDGVNWSFLGLPEKNTSLRVSALSVNPNNSNNLFVAVSSTIFKSANGGLTWETKILPTQSEVRRILINPQANNLIYLGLAAPRQ